MKKYIGSLTRFGCESGKLFLCLFVLQKSRLSATLSLGLALFAGGGKRSFDYAKRARRNGGMGWGDTKEARRVGVLPVGMLIVGYFTITLLTWLPTFTR